MTSSRGIRLVIGVVLLTACGEQAYQRDAKDPMGVVSRMEVDASEETVEVVLQCIGGSDNFVGAQATVSFSSAEERAHLVCNGSRAGVSPPLNRDAFVFEAAAGDWTVGVVLQDFPADFQPACPLLQGSDIPAERSCTFEDADVTGALSQFYDEALLHSGVQLLIRPVP